MKKILILTMFLTLLSTTTAQAYSPYGKSQQTYYGNNNNYQRNSYQQQSYTPSRVDMYNEQSQHQGFLKRSSDDRVDIYNQYGQYQGFVKSK